MRKKSLNRLLLALVVVTLWGCSKSTPAPQSQDTSATNSAPAAQSAPPPAAPAAPAPAARPAPARRAPAPKPIVVEAGTVIQVSLDQSITSESSNQGDHFEASVAEPVVVGGKVVIPKDARASGTVVLAKSAGRFKGNAELGLRLDSVTVRGKAYRIETSEVEEAGKGRGKRTAIGAGAGAAVGGIIGAIAGGGKGAAIGAGAGAGAGTAGAALSGNREIALPAETKLQFRLSAPLELK
jgi:hypothetical protein